MAFLLLVAGLIVFWSIWGGCHSAPPSTPNTAGNRVLINGTIVVSENIYYIQFIVRNGAFNIHVNGNFAVLGGESIRVYILNEDNFDNMGVSGYKFAPNYDSGQSTGGDISSTLPSGGTFYLLFDNRFQTSQKTLEIEATVTYYSS